MSKMTYLWLSGVFFSSSKYTKTRFRPWLRPIPRWGSLRRSPRPSSWLGRGTPYHSPSTPRRLDLDAFGASVVRPPTQIPGYAYGLPIFLAYSWPTLSEKPGAASDWTPNLNLFVRESDSPLVQ